MSKKQKRQVSTSQVSTPTAAAESAVARPAAQAVASRDFNPDYTYIKQDLKRIGIMALSFFVILVALSFFLN